MEVRWRDLREAESGLEKLEVRIEEGRREGRRNKGKGETRGGEEKKIVGL